MIYIYSFKSHFLFCSHFSICGHPSSPTPHLIHQNPYWLYFYPVPGSDHFSHLLYYHPPSPSPLAWIISAFSSLATFLLPLPHPNPCPVCFPHSDQREPLKTNSDHITPFFSTFQIICLYPSLYHQLSLPPLPSLISSSTPLPSLLCFCHAASLLFPPQGPRTSCSLYPRTFFSKILAWFTYSLCSSFCWEPT